MIERGRHKQNDGKTNIYTVRYKPLTDRDRHESRHAYIHTNGKAYRQAKRRRQRQTDLKQTERPTGGWMDGRIDKQTDRQKGRTVKANQTET